MSTHTDQPTTDAAAEREQVQNPLTLVMELKSAEAAEGIRHALTQPGGLTAQIDAVLNKLKIVHFARFVILDGEPPKLAVITSYDGDFEDYILEFTKKENLGGVFDQILPAVADPPPMPVSDNAEAFVAWVQAHDLRCVGTFYSAYPLKRANEIMDS